MKKLRKPRHIRINLAKRRFQRRLRSKAKRIHRLGPGYNAEKETAT